MSVVKARRHARDRVHGATPVAAAAGLTAAAAACGAVWVSEDQLIAVGAAALLAGLAAASTAFVAVRRLVIAPARAREHHAARLLKGIRQELNGERRDRGALRELNRALDQAEDEDAALVVVGHAFARHFPDRPIELHLLSANEPVLVLEVALCRPRDVLGHRSSPWDPVATRTGTTQIYKSTDQVDACSHVRGRVGHPRSVVAVPLDAAGRIIGLVYAFGPDGEAPDDADVRLLEDFASAIAARLAFMRTTSAPARSDSVDGLTGLPDRAATQKELLDLVNGRRPFSVAIADIDGLDAINRIHGRDRGDAALAQMARIARRVIRPGDVVGRIGGDSFLFLLPDTEPADACRAIDRVREELIISNSADDGAPAFMISTGVVGARTGVTIDAVLKAAASALETAQTAGGNRTVITEPLTSRR